MPFATTAAIVGATLAAGGLSAGASVVAAGKQASAAKSAAQLQYEESQNALDFQKQEFQTQQANEAPFLKAGQTAVNSLSQYAPFQAPTLAEAEQEPGFKFQLREGTQALEQGSAARGDLYSGTEGRALEQFGQGLADTTYNQVYNRALNTYEANLNRLQSLAGEGLTSAGQLGTEGQAAAGNVGNIDLTTGRNIAQEMNNAAAAEASGYIGGANALTGTVNSLSQYALLNNLINPANNTNASLYTDPGLNVMTPGASANPYAGPIAADPTQIAEISG